MLRLWRIKKGLNLDAAAAFLGLKSAGALSDLERGIVFPTPETMAKIEGATLGAIQPAHHWKAWRGAHPIQFSEFRAAGRAAAKANRPPAQPKTKESKHGAKGIRGR